jgi:hypothetical protein
VSTVHFPEKTKDFADSLLKTTFLRGKIATLFDDPEKEILLLHPFVLPNLEPLPNRIPRPCFQKIIKL